MFRTENINHFQWWQNENVITPWPVKYRVRQMKPLTSKLKMWYCAACPEILHTSWDGDSWVKWWLAGQNLNSENTLLHFHLVQHTDLIIRAWKPRFRGEKSASNRLSYNFYHCYLISTLNKMYATQAEPKECSLYRNCNPTLENNWPHNWKHSLKSRVPY
jgi:hypothetical protein